ncbi:MAG: hypothetical protein M2R45_01847 [Verrucomicrobia subdivision 3 bacterium]|nr:hypothetical protein [Limisphaerales bacterium]MCS1415647.1 hypothetical protein [Limisphaerales bacterium]
MQEQAQPQPLEITASWVIFESCFDLLPVPQQSPSKNPVLERRAHGYFRERPDETMIDNRQIRNQVLLRHIGSPLVLAPFLFGITSLTAAWAFDWKAASIAAFAGLAGIIGAGGIFLTRLILGGEKTAAQVIQEMEADELAHKERELDQLERRLESSDNDPRPEKSLQDLRALIKVFQETRNDATSHQLTTMVDIHAKVTELFDHCVELLEQTIQLWETATSLNTEAARKPILEQRETIVEDIQASVQQLSTTLVGLKQLGTAEASTGRLRQMRDELDQSLKVARNIEARVDKWMREAKVSEK